MNNVSYSWQLIEQSITDRRLYNHNELFHAICVNDFCSNIHGAAITDNFKPILSKCYSQRYRHLGLTANATDFNCSNVEDEPGIYDFIWVFFIFTYATYTIYATIWDYHFRANSNNYGPNKTGKKYIIPFSFINNWAKFTTENKSPDFQKLKSIQGIRFYNMLLIIFCHTYSSYIGGYVQNTSYLENIQNNPIKLGVRNLFVFLVQSFFLISSFLLSYHIFQVMDKTRFNIKYIVLAFLNRYLRIIPSVLMMMGVGTTIWIVSLYSGPIKEFYSYLEYRRCRKNWWTILLFINNHYNQYDMCYFITWYLAADTQLYLLSLIVLSVIWKFRHKTKFILALCLVIAILIPTVISYIYNLDVIYRITPENSKNNKFRSFSFNAIYSSTYANMATYIVGLCTGYIYFKMKNNTSSSFVEKPVYKLLWWAAFFGLPTLVIIWSSYYYTRLYSALLCGILKPLYALGIGIGIIGMSQQLGGIAKKICEWSPAVYLGNLTYSTYLVHYGIVFYRTATVKQPLYVSDYVLLTSFLCDAILSFVCGFLTHIFVELPALQLQNYLVPQVRNQRSSSNAKNM
ncbi:hypothetical protein NQ317_002786 [Molorchus minor]|uniref:Acyltransferase 3 domain-containing protein n=1 Tax=Molorchus minor TaxID=1323400 RepID=A0ABQ9J5T8_9CUCU|nr:hypothetical protein NQ317_002786 [Molorchus minor]